MIFWRKAPEASQVSLSRDGGNRFHPIGRAPRRSRPTLLAEHDDRAATVTLDIGIGEPGSETTMLTVTTAGRFTLRPVSKNELVSVRGRDLPTCQVKITVAWASE